MTSGYVVRGYSGNRSFKIVGGRVVEFGFAAGEDVHASAFAAITGSVAALRAWQFKPAGAVFDVEPSERK